MKLMRIIFSLLILILIILVFALVSLFLFVNPNSFKPLIISEVKKKTGYELKINGDLKWSFYPEVSIIAKELLLYPPQKKTPILTLHSIRFSTALKNFINKHQFDGDVSIANLQFDKLRAHDAEVGIHFVNRELTLSPFNALFYGGKLNGVIRGQFANTTQWRGMLQLSDIDLGSLLADLTPGNNKITLMGKGYVDLEGSTSGVSKPQLLGNLTGACSVQVNGGKLIGVDLNYLLHAADALLNKEPLPSQGANNETPFTRLVGHATILQGVIMVNTLQLNTETFNGSGTGKLNLLTEQINMTATLNSEHTLKTQWSAPLIISGTFQNPQVALDVQAISKKIASEGVEKVKSSVKEQIEKILPEKAGEFINRMLGH